MAANSTAAPLSAPEKDWLRKWLLKAEQAMAAAELLAAQADQYETAAFHCQQAVEKYLKARGYAALLTPSRTHDLNRLMRELSGIEAFTASEIQLAELLNPFAVGFRYPSDEAPDEPPIADLLAAARHFRDRLRPTIEAALN